MSQDKPKTLRELLAQLPDAPSSEQIEGWKAQFNVYGAPFSESEIFLFRPLTRQEHDAVQKTAFEAQQEGKPFDPEQEIVNLCVLWGSVAGKKALESKAGTLSTLQEQISMHSNFYPPAVAAAMVEEL